MNHRVITQLTFNIVREIGAEGANSKAYLAYDPQLDATLVVKAIPKKDFNINAQLYFLESQIIYNSKHPNIMEINYACEDKDHIYFSMPFYQKGSLNSLLDKRFLTTREIIGYSLDFLSGLHFIHSKQLVHFDIKPTNLIINDSNHAILTDFGLSKYANQYGFASPDKIYGAHRPPESLVTTSLTSQYDIYQAGLTLYRMCNGNINFKEQNVNFSKENLKNAKFPDRGYFLPHIPNTLRNYIKKALEVDLNKRYQTVLELMNDLSNVEESLDWQYSIMNSEEMWVLDSDTTSKKITLRSHQNEWSIEGYRTSKKTGKTSRISQCFSQHKTKKIAYKEISSFINKI